MARNEETPENGQNVHGFQVRTPICHIVPVSRTYPYIPPNLPLIPPKCFGPPWVPSGTLFVGILSHVAEPCPSFPLGLCANQERKRHIKLRKILRTPAGCSWDTRRDKQGSTSRCPKDFLLFAVEKLGPFAGTPAGCPKNSPACPGGFQKFYVICSYVPFLLPSKLFSLIFVKEFRDCLGKILAW